MAIVGWILVAAGAIMAIIYGIQVLIIAFKTSVLWGLGSLFVPFVGLIFVIMHWQETKKPFLMSLVGSVIAIIGIALVGPSLAEAAAAANQGSVTY